MIWFCHTLSGANHKQWYTFLINTIVNNKIFMGHLVYLKNRNGKTSIHPIDKFKDNPTKKTAGFGFIPPLLACVVLILHRMHKNLIKIGATTN